MGSLCFSNSNRIVIVHGPLLGWVQTVATKYEAPALELESPGALEFNELFTRNCEFVAHDPGFV